LPLLRSELAARTATRGVDWDWKRLPGPLWWRYLADALTAQRERFGVHDFLRRKAALAGVEGGHPFLDDGPLVDLALRLPPESAFDRDLDRPLLREAMAGIVPDPIRLRPDKSVFNSVFARALDGPDRAPIRRLLADPNAEVNAYVRPERVREHLLDRPPGRTGMRWAWPLWRLAMIECWLRAQANPSFPDEVLAGWDLSAPAITVVASVER
jgi:asparagine synthetase B (glutamine-hydrolysing)